MSYCRFNKSTSDVYVFGSANNLECYVAYETASAAMVRQSFVVPYGNRPAGEVEKVMYGHLCFLRDQGLRVPEYALRRLMDEIAQAEDELYED